MFNDPYDDTQVKFHRTDPTGRITPLHVDDDDEPDFTLREAVGGLIVFAALVAYCLYSVFK